MNTKPRPENVIRAVGLILAAGSSRRMGGFDKVFADLAGKPVLVHSLLTFSLMPAIAGTLIVTAKSSVDEVKNVCDDFAVDGILGVIPGGAERNDSARLGLEELERLGFGENIVLIHDAARPLVSTEIISNVINSIGTTNGAIPVVALNDTIKQVNEDNIVEETIPRNSLRAVQTPQGFKLGYILGLHRKAKENSAPITDDAMLVETAGGKVITVQGSYSNIKITRPEDLKMAVVLLNSYGD